MGMKNSKINDQATILPLILIVGFGTAVSSLLLKLKGIFSDSNNIFLWHESEDINKKSLNPKFQLIPILRFQVMHDYVCFISVKIALISYWNDFSLISLGKCTS